MTAGSRRARGDGRTHLGAVVGAVLAAACVLSGCATTLSGAGSVSGSGVPAGGASSVSASNGGDTDFPSVSASPGVSSDAPTSGTGSSSTATAPPAGSTCPSVKYLEAKIAFTCITAGMEAVAGDPIWPLLEIKQVDPSGWALQEGAARYTGRLTSLDSIIYSTRTAMLDSGAYLDGPTVITLTHKSGTFGGRQATYIESQITLDPAAASARGTKVRVERLWILAVQTEPGFITLWHVSLPDLAKSLWPKVPKAIAGIKVQT